MCHFCCYFSSPKHDEVYLHMWLHHSKEDFELFGWAPWIVYNGTTKGLRTLMILYKALGDAVKAAVGIPEKLHQKAM